MTTFTNAEQWGLTAVIKPCAGIAQGTREHLEAILTNRGDRASIEGFIDGVDIAVGNYRGGRDAYENNTPGQMRKNLRTAFNAANKLRATLQALDSNSSALLSEQSHDVVGKLIANAKETIDALSTGLTKADNFGSKGKRPVDTPRIILAAHIRHLLIKHLEIEATATKTGVFEEIFDPPPQNWSTVYAMERRIEDGNETT